MYYFSSYIQLFFPFITLLLLLIGLRSQRRKYLLASLWLSLIGTVLHYQTANGEILGSYFDYKQALIYSIDLMVLLISLCYFIVNSTVNLTPKILRYGAGFAAAFLSTGTLLILYNVWFNAYFLSDRMPNTPLLQVATFKKLDYCEYKYVFYKVTQQGKVSYMCPNRYGLLPSQGYLEKAPQFVIKQLPNRLQVKFKQDNLESSS